MRQTHHEVDDRVRGFEQVLSWLNWSLRAVFVGVLEEKSKQVLALQVDSKRGDWARQLEDCARGVRLASQRPDQRHGPTVDLWLEQIRSAWHWLQHVRPFRLRQKLA